MNDFIIARALHVLAVLMWIGGVGFVTAVVIPYVRHGRLPARRLDAFLEFERRFAPQARIWVLLAGATGFWMTYRASLWSRFTDPHFWWMHAMIVLWAIFMAMLFIVEPFFLSDRLKSSTDPVADFDRLEFVHRILLMLTTITLLCAVAGSHGLI